MANTYENVINAHCLRRGQIVLLKTLNDMCSLISLASARTTEQGIFDACSLVETKNMQEILVVEVKAVVKRQIKAEVV